MTKARKITNKKMKRVKKFAQISKLVNYVMCIITGIAMIVVPIVMFWDYITYERLDFIGWAGIIIPFMCVFTHYVEYKAINRFRRILI